MSKKPVTKPTQNPKSASNMQKVERPSLFLINPLDLCLVPTDQFHCYMDALQVLMMNFHKTDFDGSARSIDLLESTITSVDFFLVVTGIVKQRLVVSDFISKQQYKPNSAAEWLEMLRPDPLAVAKAIADPEAVDKPSVIRPPSPSVALRSWAEDMDDHDYMVEKQTAKPTVSQVVKGMGKSLSVPQPSKKAKLEPRVEKREASPASNDASLKQWQRRRSYRQKPNMSTASSVFFRQRVAETVPMLGCCGLTLEDRTQVINKAQTGDYRSLVDGLSGIQILPLYYIESRNDQEHFIEDFLKWHTLPAYACTTDKALWEIWPSSLKRTKY